MITATPMPSLEMIPINSWRRNVWLVLALSAAVFAATEGCRRDEVAPVSQGLARSISRPEFYSSDAIECRVYDAVTSKPVTGAVVVALWRRMSIAGEWRGTFRWEEAVTDKDGQFVIHRWGPRYLEPDHDLDGRDPELWILKRGYLLGYFDNTGRLDPRYFSAAQIMGPGKLPPARSTVRILGQYSRKKEEPFVWNGKTLTLSPAAPGTQIARSLEAANPIDTFDPIPPKLRLFWDEWIASYEALPSESRSAVTPPRPLVKYRALLPTQSLPASR